MSSRAAGSVADGESRVGGTTQGAGGAGLLDLDTMHQRALDEINRRLLKQKSKIFTVVEMLRHDDLSSSSNKRKANCIDASERAPFNPGYTQLKQVERAFVASVIAESSNLNADELVVLEKYAKNAISTLLHLGCGFPPSTKWPKPAKERLYE
eukprot:6492718-Amphidinium_carterae.1